MSPSLMALLPLGLACHQSSSLSQYLSRMDWSGVELFRTTARTLWVKHKSRPAALSQRELLILTLLLEEEPWTRLSNGWIPLLEPCEGAFLNYINDVDIVLQYSDGHVQHFLCKSIIMKEGRSPQSVRRPLFQIMLQ